MEKYNWDEDSIMNSSDLNDKAKIILLSELYKIKDEIISDESDSITLEKFKKKYNTNYNELYQFSNKMLKYITNLYQTSNPITPTLHAKTPIDITPNFIMEVMQDYIINTADIDIINTYAKIINNDKNYIRIYPRENTNEAIQDFKGRCIIPEGTQDTYISIYQTGYMNDLALAAHEFGHAIEHRLFFKNKNPLIQNYLTEVSSYFFELVMSAYVTCKFDYPLTGLMLEGTRTNKTIDSIWNIKIQSELNKQIMLSPEKINKILNKLGRPVQYNKEQLKYIAKTGLYYNSNLINSYMIATKLFYIYLGDPEYAIQLYKELMQSDEVNLEKFLDKFNINYLEDNQEFTEMQKKSEAIRKMISK